jgi:hypothetical protein
VVFGATGQQGSSVISKVLEDAELSKTYRIRGLTRDPSKADAQALSKRGVEVVRCDTGDRSSIRAALDGAHTVFAMTVSLYKPGGMEEELAQGKAIADEAVAAGVHFLVYSSVPSPKKMSGGKYPVDSFDVKDQVRDYISGLPIKSAFFLPGCELTSPSTCSRSAEIKHLVLMTLWKAFMQNFHTNMAPRPGPDGNPAFRGFVSPDTKYPLIDIAGDTGKFVGGHPRPARRARGQGARRCHALLHNDRDGGDHGPLEREEDHIHSGPQRCFRRVPA